MRKIIETPKDTNGAYQKVIVSSNTPEVSIDEVMREGLINIKRIIEKVSIETTRPGMPDNLVLKALSECMKMLKALKIDEQDLIDAMSDDDLKKLIK